MALDVVQFVDSIAASPTVRLDLNNEAPWAAPYEGADFSPPRLRRAVASTLLRDGATYPASAYDDRVLKLRLELQTSTVDGQAAALQALAREVDRPTNFLRWQPVGATHPVFFRTIRSDMARITDYPGPGTFRTVDVELLAEPFAYGLSETLPRVIISNDPDDRFPANANPYFETDVSNWTPQGGTFVRSTAQAHQGVASGLLTPDGVSASATVRSELAPSGLDSITQGTPVRASAWVRCAVSRNVIIGIDWHDSGGGFLSASTATVAVTANLWTFLQVRGVAPASTQKVKVTVAMDATPLASHTLHVDEVKVREAGNDLGGMSWEITGVKGDVETPPLITIQPGSTPGATRQILLGVRRRDTTGLPLIVQTDLGTTGADTSQQSGDTAMSGGTYARTTFAAQPTMQTRLTLTWATLGTNLRGRYRVFARVRKSVASDVIRMQLKWVLALTTAPVTLPTTTDIRWIDLGVVTVPAYNDPVYDGYSGQLLGVSAVLFQVQAARDSGTGNLDMDCFAVVPAAGPPTSPGDDRLALLTVSLDRLWTVDAIHEAMFASSGSGLFVDNQEPAPVAGLYPLLSPSVPNRMTLMANAGLAGPADSLQEAVDVEVRYWPRYLMVRPVGT